MPWPMARLEDVHPIFCHARSDRCLAAKHMGTRMSARADVIVLGAGIVGVSVALHLQKRDRDVVLIDRQEAGEETSYGNAGLIQREAVIPYTFPRELSVILSYAMNHRRDAVYHLSALPRVAPWLFRYWQNATPERVERSARALAPLMAQCVDEHEGLDAFAGIVGAAQPAVALAFELDCERLAGILDIVYQLLRAALRQWRKAAQLFGQPIARRFKFVIGDAVGRPLVGLPGGNPPRAHHNVLGSGDADHLLQARGAARTRDLAETLLGKGIKAGFRG